jgi:RNA 3'-terminal phosphate cyclase (ATP)
MIVIDGSHGEGGGAVLRSALSLSTVLGKPTRIENIRSRRPNPGLRAQHLTAVRALARVCGAKLDGAELGSSAITFRPQSSPRSGEYSWDVADARRGGSAGATSLVFQALLLSLVFADGESRLFLGGGTHVAWSPPFHYLESVYLPMLRQLGVEARVDIERWGWYPKGGGVVTAQIAGCGASFTARQGVHMQERGRLKRLSGISALSNLPLTIAHRQKRRAETILRAEGFEPEIEIINAPATGQGTALFLVAEFENVRAGFTALGRKGKPAELVAEEACKDFVLYYESGAALDRYLADQVVPFLAMAEGESSFSTSCVTQHLLTNIWITERLVGRQVLVEGAEGKRGKVIITGRTDV